MIPRSLAKMVLNLDLIIYWLFFQNMCFVLAMDDTHMAMHEPILFFFFFFFFRFQQVLRNGNISNLFEFLNFSFIFILVQSWGRQIYQKVPMISYSRDISRLAEIITGWFPLPNEVVWSFKRTNIAQEPKQYGGVQVEKIRFVLVIIRVHILPSVKM